MANIGKIRSVCRLARLANGSYINKEGCINHLNHIIGAIFHFTLGMFFGVVVFYG